MSKRFATVSPLPSQLQVEIVDVTPELAARWLDRNTRNRPLNKRIVNKYAEDMRAKNWVVTHQGLAFYASGEVADGQHRLQAVVQSGETVRFFVTHGLADRDAVGIDQNATRAMQHVMQFMGEGRWADQSIIAVMRVYASMVGEGSCNTEKNLSVSQALEALEIYGASVMFGAKVFPGKRKYLTTALLRAAIGAASCYENWCRLKCFADVLYSGLANGPEDSAAIRLREFLLSGKYQNGHTERMHLLRRAQRAIMAFCKGEQLTLLRAPDRLLYVPKPDQYLDLVRVQEFFEG